MRAIISLALIVMVLLAAPAYGAEINAIYFVNTFEPTSKIAVPSIDLSDRSIKAYSHSDIVVTLSIDTAQAATVSKSASPCIDTKPKAFNININRSPAGFSA